MVYLLIGLTLLFSNELEVEGSLKVTGGIDAQGQSVSNVGNPVLESDATNLSTVRSMMGMKPERIYKVQLIPSQYMNYTVPEGKFWVVTPGTTTTNSIGVSINGEPIGAIFSNSNNVITQFYAFSGESISLYIHFEYTSIVNIFEYPISGSGTEQGMDYIVP